MRKEYKYTTGKKNPIEHLIFQINPQDLNEFIQADHEVWNLGDITLREDGVETIPFISKEVWVNEYRPGIVHYVLVWEDMETWSKAAYDEMKEILRLEFKNRFRKPFKLLCSVHKEEDYGMHRISRLERVDND